MTRCLQRCALDKSGVWRVKSTVKLQKGQKQEKVESSATRATASKSKKGPKVKQSAAEAKTERQVAQTAAEAKKERRKELQRGYEKTRQEKLKKSGMKVYRPREGLNVGRARVHFLRRFSIASPGVVCRVVSTPSAHAGFSEFMSGQPASVFFSAQFAWQDRLSKRSTSSRSRLSSKRNRRCRPLTLPELCRSKWAGSLLRSVACTCSGFFLFCFSATSLRWTL